jgi:hypothetical protein
MQELLKILQSEKLLTESATSGSVATPMQGKIARLIGDN